MLSDLEFDRVFPPELRHLSVVHWTPIEAAVRAARWLAPEPGVRARILDVGAGVGKACLIGALTTTAEWTGIERDPDHVRAAGAAAQQLGVTARTRFTQGDASMIDWSEFDGIYLYNPLGSLWSDSARVDPGQRRPTFDGMLRRIEQRLELTRVGTRVVTFHGFGGEMPAGYEMTQREQVATGGLELWIRAR